MEIGLDVGTGFTKSAAGGKTFLFPSLYTAMYSDRKSIDDLSGRERLVETVGFDALKTARGVKASMVRPVQHGMPFNTRGFRALVKNSLTIAGINDSIAETTICVGITYDAKEKRKDLEKIVRSFKPKSCIIVPQAYGTLVYAGKKTGTVVNIGHGTTEIISITPGNIDGKSVKMGGDYVMSQLSSGKGDYVNFGKLFSKYPEKTANLVRLLVDGIVDELSRVLGSGDNDIILAGGGSLIPGVREEIKKIGRNVIFPDDPVFSNAIGLEMMAMKRNGKSSPIKPAVTKPPEIAEKPPVETD